MVTQNTPNDFVGSTAPEELLMAILYAGMTSALGTLLYFYLTSTFLAR